METITEYLIKSTVWLTGFAFVYILFLRNERFFTLNRAFLVTGIIASICFPWFNFHYTVLIPMVPITELTETPLATAGIVQEEPIAENLLFYTYLSGILYLVFRLLKQTISVVRVIQKSGVSTYNNVRLVRTDRYPAPFSFFSFVFVNPSINKTETNEIVHHEQEHIRQRHWIDLLLFELLCILQWFNPMVWLYGRFIRQNHEYLADEQALQRTANPAMYRAALLNQMFGGPVIQLANSFNYSLNKKRFTMMKQTISSPVRKLRLLLVLPLIAGVFYAFATPEYQFIEQENPESALVQSEKMIKGKVTDENGSPLKGASVIISGKTIGTITDDNGVFIFKVTDDSPIVVSYVGFQTAKMNPDFEKEMSFILKTEVVKIGFQGKAVKTATSSGLSDKVLVIIDGEESSKVQMETINPENIESISVLKDQSAAALYGDKGKDGVIVIKTKIASPAMEFSAKEMEVKHGESISLKEPQKIKIRNATGKEPLVVVNGTIAESKRLEDIDPTTIESMNVLKNEAAISKYGDKAKDGAIEITMKASAIQLNSTLSLSGATTTQPLYFLDGKEMNYQELSGISPDKIASVSVLKNESATSIYGEKAKNGVVLIESKKATTGNEEVVVVGYGKKPDNLLKSGVQIRSTGGSVPLIVKDGVVSPKLKMDDIDPNEIESINVLKDEPATAKYGENGKNGVLEIKMKKQGEVFSIVEEMPQFPGGQEALRSLVQTSINYPAIALENGIEGKVFVKFVVSKTGKVTNAKIARGVDPSLDKEAVRIVESLPLWKPGRQNGEAVDVNYTIPVNFTLPANRPSKEKLVIGKSTNPKKEKKAVIETVQSAHRLLIVPNPAKDNAVISIENYSETKKLEVRILDIKGQLVKRETKRGPSFSMSFAGFAPGTYLVVVYDGTNQFSGQIVINH
jgi:TonB family protein